MQRNALIIVILVAVLILAFVFYNFFWNTNSKIHAYDNLPVSSAFAARLNNVPNSLLSQVGMGASNPTYIKTVNATKPLTLNGKPEILYVGANYCPFCASQRWPMIIALSRFGNFSNLHYMSSSATDQIAPNVATFTFYNSTYTSNYISFVTVELTNNFQVNGTYAQLQKLNNSQIAILNAYNPQQSIPFLDLANHSVVVGATYYPSVLLNRNWTYILNQTYNASTQTSQSILGSANLLTAEICKIDNNMPQSVCTQSYIQNIETQLS